MPRNYSWSFDARAEKQFCRLDRPVQARILRWIESNIQNCENPRLFGKALEGEYENLWRYRIGKYRLIADIQDGIFKVLVVKVGKRSYCSHPTVIPSLPRDLRPRQRSTAGREAP